MLGVSIAFHRPLAARNRAGERTMKDMAKISFNRDAKFDLQLNQALLNERRLAEIFESQKIEKIELKSETWQWERTGNIAIEYRCDEKPSGISITQADFGCMNCDAMMPRWFI
jgi:hypothetical protein